MAKPPKKSKAEKAAEKKKRRAKAGLSSRPKAPLRKLWEVANDETKKGTVLEAGLEIEAINELVRKKKPLPEKIRKALERRITENQGADTIHKIIFGEAATHTPASNGAGHPTEFDAAATSTTAKSHPETVEQSPTKVAMAWVLSDRNRTQEVAEDLGLPPGVFRKLVNGDRLGDEKIAKAMETISFMHGSPIQRVEEPEGLQNTGKMA